MVTQQKKTQKITQAQKNKAQPNAKQHIWGVSNSF